MGKNKNIECKVCEQWVSKKDSVKLPGIGRVCKHHTEFIEHHTKPKVKFEKPEVKKELPPGPTFPVADKEKVMEFTKKTIEKVKEKEVVKMKVKAPSKEKPKSIKAAPNKQPQLTNEMLVSQMVDQMKYQMHRDKVNAETARQYLVQRMVSDSLNQTEKQALRGMIDLAYLTASSSKPLTNKEALALKLKYTKEKKITLR